MKKGKKNIEEPALHEHVYGQGSTIDTNTQREIDRLDPDEASVCKYAEDDTHMLPYNLTLGKLRKLFRVLCVHACDFGEKKMQPSPYPLCDKCLLCNVDGRSLCGDIWEDNILEGKIK